MSLRILIVGVGGQGTIFATKILCDVLGRLYPDSKVSEVHGMSQRGGSVITHVQAGDKIYSPVVASGEADVIVSFEKLEGPRYLGYLKKGGLLITAEDEIAPMPVLTGACDYPKDILEDLVREGVQVIRVPARRKAEEAGSPKAVNLVLLGRLAKEQNISAADFLEAIDRNSKAAFAEANRKAFLKGMEE